MNAIEDIPARLAEEIALRAYDDKYIDRNEEREILQIAIQLGVRLPAARASLVEVCEREGFSLESSALGILRAKVKEVSQRVAKLDEAAFTELLATARTALGNLRNEREAKILLVELIEENGPPKVKTGLFRNWYAAMKRELGLA